MHFPLSVAFLSVCILALQCTAREIVSEEIENGSEGASEAAVTATTTTAAPIPQLQVQQPIHAAEPDPSHAEDTHGEAEQDDGHAQAELLDKSKKEGSEHEPDADAEHATEGKDQTERRDTQENDVGLPAATKKPPATENVNSDQNPEGPLGQAKDAQEQDRNSGQEAHAEKSGGQLQQDLGEADLSHGKNGKHTAGHKTPEVKDISANLPNVINPSTREVKTNIATAAVEKPSGPKGDTGKEQSNGHAKKETHDLEVRDARTAGQTTNPAVTKTGEQSAQSTTTSGGVTGGKKEQKVSPVSPQTTEVTQQKEKHAAITPGTNSGEKETIQKQKQNSTTTTTAEPTTSTVASTTNLPKGFNIPQSFDKTDGSRSTSLLIAFATVVTFTVATAAPVY